MEVTDLNDAALVSDLIVEPEPAPTPVERRTVRCSVCGYRYAAEETLTCCPRYLSHPIVRRAARRAARNLREQENQ
jgi:hypothetical protein